MIRKNLRAVGFLLLLFAAPLALAQSGGGYDLEWNTIDGGGGTSSGGVYELSGTAGQHDGGGMSGGAYVLEGGFWPGAGATACAPPPATIAQTAPSQATFTWDAGTQDVYRAVDDPYFAGGALIGDDVSSPWSYAESLLGDTNQNAYYVVGDPAGCGKRLGGFDFPITPGS